MRRDWPQIVKQSCSEESKTQLLTEYPAKNSGNKLIEA